MGKLKLKIMNTADIEARVLEAVYGDRWQTEAAHNETALLFDILDRINGLLSENRALRTAMRP